VWVDGDAAEPVSDGKCCRRLDDRSEVDNRAGDPKQKASARNIAGREFHCQWAMTGAGDILSKLLLVRRYDEDAAPPARNRHVPLLRVRRRLDGRIGEQNIIHRLALRTVGRDRVAGKKLAEAFVQNATISQFNFAIGTDRFHSDEFAIRDAPA
jgi:hypothetical protein